MKFAVVKWSLGQMIVGEARGADLRLSTLFYRRKAEYFDSYRSLVLMVVPQQEVERRVT